MTVRARRRCGCVIPSDSGPLRRQALLNGPDGRTIVCRHGSGSTTPSTSPGFQPAALTGLSSSSHHVAAVAGAYSRKTSGRNGCRLHVKHLQRAASRRGRSSSVALTAGRRAIDPALLLAKRCGPHRRPRGRSSPPPSPWEPAGCHRNSLHRPSTGDASGRGRMGCVGMVCYFEALKIGPTGPIATIYRSAGPGAGPAGRGGWHDRAGWRAQIVGNRAGAACRCAWFYSCDGQVLNLAGSSVRRPGQRDARRRMESPGDPLGPGCRAWRIASSNTRKSTSRRCPPPCSWRLTSGSALCFLGRYLLYRRQRPLQRRCPFAFLMSLAMDCNPTAA